MKLMFKRTKGVVWRSILLLPFATILLIVAWVSKIVMESVKFTGKNIVKEWNKLNAHTEKSPNLLTYIAWVVLYLPFIILSLAAVILILYPFWFIFGILSYVVGELNISLLQYVQFRKPLASEKGIVDETMVTLKQKLKDAGATDKEILQLFGPEQKNA